MNPQKIDLDKIKKTAVGVSLKVWDYVKFARFELIVLAAFIVADLVTKAIVESTMGVGDSVALIPNFLNFTFVYNEFAAFGGAFGLEKFLTQNTIRVIFIVITFIALGVFGFFLYRGRGKSKLMRLSLAMIMGGAIGNLVDRLFIGRVRDFVEIVFFGCHLPLVGKSFAIFNVADAALVVGVILFLVYFIFLYKDKNEEDEEEEEKDEAEKDPSASEEPAGTEAASAEAEPPAPEKGAAEPDSEEGGDARPAGLDEKEG